MKVYDRIVSAVDELQQGRPACCQAYFLDDPGGSGKTCMLCNTLIARLRAHGIQVGATAWTGIAANLLPGGRTVHSLFKLPVPILDTSTCNVKQTSSYAAMLRSMSLIIIDKASMMPLHALHAIDKLLRDLINEDIPFGGKIFLLGGDFRQVLPVMLHASRTLIVENCLKRLSLWPLFTIIKLTQNMRVQQDQQQFSKWELQLGNEQLHTV
ncbi:ATP-dependent DNA helicase pif1-like [Corticium candelabrum]|uniref:ATP-dependent DNA helicase pif1-like n=1 Tax=Corticium candelabrum TaxID=121492 RepID=UPI002E270477|nr:ATP-dependent DNA helicase pif1-like [Corticium candelabrum]XP_062514144.1 ATP-dependent DNA helicase pif1-like [Corticium candelabrum]